MLINNLIPKMPLILICVTFNNIIIAFINTNNKCNLFVVIRMLKRAKQTA